MSKIKLKLNKVDAAEREMSLKLTKDNVSFISKDEKMEIKLDGCIEQYNIYNKAGEPTKIELKIVDEVDLILPVDFENIVNLNKQFDKIIKKRNLEKL